MCDASRALRCGSAHGTFIDGERVTPGSGGGGAALCSGSVIVFGGSSRRYRVEGVTATAGGGGGGAIHTGAVVVFEGSPSGRDVLASGSRHGSHGVDDGLREKNRDRVTPATRGGEDVHTETRSGIDGDRGEKRPEGGRDREGVRNGDRNRERGQRRSRSRSRGGSRSQSGEERSRGSGGGRRGRDDAAREGTRRSEYERSHDRERRDREWRPRSRDRERRDGFSRERR